MRGGNDIKLSPKASPEMVALAVEIERLLDDRDASPRLLPSYTVAELATIAPIDWVNCAVIVSDESGGRTIATSDGTNWRRVRDGAIVT